MWLSAAQTVANATWTALAFDTVSFDPNGNLTTGAGAKYTFPVSGYYIATGKSTWAGVADGSRMLCGLWVNGGSRAVGNDLTAGAAGSNMGEVATDIIQANAGDTVQFMVFNQSGGSTNTGSGSDACFLSVHFLSPQ